MYKFEIGQRVVFNRGVGAKRVGSSNSVEAIIYARAGETMPVYQIRWGITGRASVLESDLSPLDSTQGVAR